MSRTRTGTIERIVVAFDAVTEHRAAIGAAARLAARWKMRLHGVFIEDDDLIRLAGYRFARQVTLGAGVENLTVAEAERQLRVFAERARLELAASAARHALEWSFEIVRAGTAETGPARPGDLVVACTTTRPVGGHYRAECRWWMIGEPGPATVLLAHREGHVDGMVAALVNEQGPAAERVIATAARLAAENGKELAVFAPRELAESAGFRTWLDGVAGRAVKVQVERLPERRAVLLRRITELGCGLVAIEAGTAAARPERLRELVAETACDVLVVR